MNYFKILSILLAVVVLGSIAYGNTARVVPTGCLTEADVRAYTERSHHGISLTCNERIRQRNLARLGEAVGRY